MSKFSNFIQKYYWYIFALFFLVLGFLCFFNLGTSPLQTWDEARHGVNAYEMMEQGNYIANYYNGSLDYWNLKPPFSFYIIMLGYKIFGFNAFGLRFFSALSYLILALLVALFVKKKLGKLESLISILLFAGSYSFLKYHFVRTADPDALFILFIGIAILSLALSDENANWLYVTGLAFAFAFLTKSWHAFILAPIVLFYTIFSKNIKKIKWWQYILAFLSAVLPIAIWAFFRYQFDGTKFFDGMIQYDLLKRSSNAIEGHTGYPFYYTIVLFWNFPMAFCAILSAVGIVYKLVKKQKLDNLDLLCIISFFSIFIIYAIAKTKLFWYVYPCAIPLYILGSKYIVNIANILQSIRFKRFIKTVYITVLTVCVFISILYINIGYPEEKLQNFIATISVDSNSTIYYQDVNSSYIAQDGLLKLELTTGNKITTGGWDSFAEKDNTYIIVSKEFLDNKNTSEYNILFENNGYALVYNP